MKTPYIHQYRTVIEGVQRVGVIVPKQGYCEFFSCSNESSYMFYEKHHKLERMFPYPGKEGVAIFAGDRIRFLNKEDFVKDDYINPEYLLEDTNHGFRLRYVGGGKDVSNAYFSLVNYTAKFEVVK